jgi:hypothetical protein
MVSESEGAVRFRYEEAAKVCETLSPKGKGYGVSLDLETGRASQRNPELEHPPKLSKIDDWNE